MNRKERRAAARQRIPGGYLIGQHDVLAKLDFHCPDCDSELHRYLDHHGIQRVDIRHDDTCPIWQSMQSPTERNHP